MEVQKKGAYRWALLVMLVLSFTATFFSRFVWASLLSTAAGEMNMTMAQAGSLMSAFYFGYLFTQIPGGWMADRFRAKYLLVGCVALVGVMTLMMSMPFVNNYTAGYAVRFIGGLFGGAVMAFCSRLLCNYFDPKERGVAMGILLASPSLGTLLANQIGPRILVASGWRAAFRVTAIIILVIAVVDVLVIREPKRDKSAAAAAEKVSLIDGLKNFFSNKQIVLLAIVGFLYMALPAGYSTWANKFMTGDAPAGAGISAVQAGTIVTCYAIASIIGSMASGAIGRKFNINRKYFIMVVYVVMAITIVLFGMQRSFGGLMLFSVLFGLFSCASSTHITIWAVNIGGNKYAATTTAVQNLILQLANVIFPTVAGSIIDRATVDGAVTSYMGVWWLYGILVSLSFVVCFFLSKKSAAESM